MTVRLTWVDNNVDETGHQIYRSTSPMDPAALPAPIATLAADVTTYDDTTAPADTDCYYRVAAVRNGELAVSSESMINTGTVVAPTPPAIGEYWTGQGGYYAGDITYADGRQFHLVVADKSADNLGIQWKTSRTLTAGTFSEDDGLANTLLITNTEHPAGNYCATYTVEQLDDFYLGAKNEMYRVYLNLGPFGANTPAIFKSGGDQAFSTNNDYWSSTQINANDASEQRFSSGSQGAFHYKDSLIYARPLRRVAKTA